MFPGFFGEDKALGSSQKRRVSNLYCLDMLQKASKGTISLPPKFDIISRQTHGQNISYEESTHKTNIKTEYFCHIFSQFFPRFPSFCRLPWISRPCRCSAASPRAASTTPHRRPAPGTSSETTGTFSGPKDLAMVRTSQRKMVRSSQFIQFIHLKQSHSNASKLIGISVGRMTRCSPPLQASDPGPAPRTEGGKQKDLPTENNLIRSTGPI